MALKLTLKANEKLIVGRAVLRNGAKPAEIFIENNIPILRERDILKEEDATSLCRRIYFVVQLMYVDETNLPEYHKAYWDMIRELLPAVPSTKQYIEDISVRVAQADYYHALKTARKLIDYEDELIRSASSAT